MKRFMELVTQIKFVWGLFFTSGIIVYTIIAAILGEGSMAFTDIWLLGALTFFLSFVYVLIFGEMLLASISIKGKMAALFVVNYAVFLVFCGRVGLTDVTSLQSIGTFTIGYTILFFLITFAVYNYYLFTGEELNDKLTAYKQRRNMK